MVSCSSSSGLAPPIICAQGLSRVMAAYMLNRNMESGMKFRLNVRLLCVCVCVCGGYLLKVPPYADIDSISLSVIESSCDLRHGVINGHVVLCKIPIVIEV